MIDRDEVRHEFVSHVKFMARYWSNVNLENDTVLTRLEGLAFSILSALDGSSGALPSFSVVPINHPDDEPKYQEEDIAGSLHDLFVGMK